jgi:ABC-type transport system involved in cytochrome c biogenesis permease subunit
MIPTIALILMAAAAALQAVFLLMKGERQEPFSALLLFAAGALLVVTLVQRSIRISFVAVTNTYESLLFFSAVTSVVVGIFRLAVRRKTLHFVLFGASIVALALLMISSSPALPKEVQPPIPALQSLWLVLHVTLAFIGESFFVVSFVAAIVYLATKNADKGKDADRIMYTSIGIGYPIFTIGALIFGAIWAQNAWGRYWGWDPKETWALVTWLIYTAYLHTRMVRRLRGRLSAILAIVGFVCTVFTFFGVNYLLSGLHSYGG